VKEPRWVDPRTLALLHAESLAEHGGFWGLRDEAALEPALARPRHLFAYERRADLARLAAAYGFGLVRNHPFNDGNKRAGFLAVGLFLALNGLRLDADPIEAVQTIMALAAGQFSEQALADWIRARIARLK
jgi:death on curing protein